MSDSEHLRELAPLPWQIKKHHSRPHLYRLVDAQDLTVLLIPGRAGTGTGDRAKEIAEYVFSAANSHEELLAAGDGLADIILSLLEGEEHSDHQLEELRDSWLETKMKAEGSE